MLEACGFYIEREVLVFNYPFFRIFLFVLPLSSALSASVIVSMDLLPYFLVLVCFPDYLRIRSSKDYVLPDFELFALSRIKYLIVFPVVCYY